MTDEDILLGITEAMRVNFELPALMVSIDTMPADVPGWDSIANVGLALALEQRFRVRIDPMLLDEIACVGDLVDVVRAASGLMMEG